MLKSSSSEASLTKRIPDMCAVRSMEFKITFGENLNSHYFVLENLERREICNAK